MSSPISDDDTHHLVRDRESLTTHQKHEAIILTPPMVLAAALMYLMRANGEVGPAESGSEGSSPSFVSPLLKITHDYVHAVPFERFLIDAPAILSVKERLGVLVNVCDAMLATPAQHEAERLRFDQLTLAFGIKPEAFESFMQAVSVKNNTAVLGDFEADKLEIRSPSAHVGLAAALVHSMMAPDGSISEQDLDRLHGVIGQYKGLLQFALQQAPAIESQSLFQTMAEALNGAQKLFVLTNVLDAMLKEGEVEAPEKKSIFQSMRSALGFTENAFKPFVLALKIKSAKSAASHDQFGTSIMRSMRAKFEKKPIGYGLQVKQEASLGRSNVQQVTRFDTAGGVHALGGGGADTEPSSVLARSTNSLSTHHGGIGISRGLGTGQVTDNYGKTARMGNQASASVSMRSDRSLRQSDGRRSAKRRSVEAAIQYARAQEILGSVRKQLESTREANAEIRARMDQPYVPGKRSARAGSPSLGRPTGPAPASKASATRPYANQIPGKEKQTAHVAAVFSASTRQLGRAAFSSLRGAIGALQLQQRVGGVDAAGMAIGGLRGLSAGKSKRDEVLLGADFYDPGFIGSIALPAVVLAIVMMAPGGGSAWDGLAARAAMQLPCWLGSTLIKPMHLPHAALGCWSSPRLRARNSDAFGIIKGDRPEHPLSGASGFVADRRLPNAPNA